MDRAKYGHKFNKPPFQFTLRRKSLLHTTIFCYIWSRLAAAYHIDNEEFLNKKLSEKVLTDGTQNPQLTEEHTTKIHPSKNLKYILMWSPPTHTIPFAYNSTGHKQFLDNNCAFNNCFVTGNKSFFGNDLTKFDVLAFNGHLLSLMKKKDLPPIRVPRQKYIFGMAESPENYPITQEFFDNFFNWTYTYRFDSDFVFTYFYVKNKKGEIIGPKRDMRWDEIENDSSSWFDRSTNIEIITKNNKKKLAAWFVSNCYTMSGREFYVDNLNGALKKYNLTVDIYGDCTQLFCFGGIPSKECDAMLGRDYFFYMALENSFAVDYVTEKVVTAYNNDVIPIVYGGANYSKFLPPGSYLDATKMTPTELADKMYLLMNNLPLYLQYFRWKKYYTVERYYHNLCLICEAINNETIFRTYSTHKEIRKWWTERYSEVKTKW